MRALKCFLLSLVAIIATGVTAGAAVVYFGLYDVAATEQHTPPVYWLLEYTMRRAVDRRSQYEPPVPDVSSPQVLQRGLAIYRAECERCHGGPGVAPEPFALGMTPSPANLSDTGRRWRTADVYWAVKFGIKMTGMPGWMYRLGEDELRAVAAFVSVELPALAPDEYRRRAKESETREVRHTPPALTRRPGPEEGKRAIQQYACATCHDIPGITGATRSVGPSLRGIAGRSFIAGTLPNSRENMVKWLMSPPQVKPRTAMPDLRVTEEDARYIAAYLERLK